MSIVDLTIAPRERNLGGFTVRRVLPFAKRRLVGPFVFFDHMGPATFEPGQGMDVRAHPHIGLATLTYLFDGEILHRDSLGCVQPIRPGAVNWMIAGRGIVHSERTPDALRQSGFHIEGLQIWIALPKHAEEVEPSFHHHPADTLPTLEKAGAAITLIAGEAYGLVSPVKTFSPLFYADAHIKDGVRLPLPDYEERAVYVVSGKVRIQDDVFEPGVMAVLKDGCGGAEIEAMGTSRVMLVGGAPLSEKRHIFWNFVHSSAARIETAKAQWQSNDFPDVPGEHERIPLPDA